MIVLSCLLLRGLTFFCQLILIFFIQAFSLRILYDCPQLSSAKRENVKGVKAFVSLSINSIVMYKSNLFHTQW